MPQAILLARCRGVTNHGHRFSVAELRKQLDESRVHFRLFARLEAGSAGEFCVDECDRKSNQGHVEEQTLDEAMKLVGTMVMVCAQGENDEDHHQILGHATENAAYEKESRRNVSRLLGRQ